MKKTFLRSGQNDIYFLGNGAGEINGIEYTGRFTGEGLVTSDYDEGSFLSNISHAQVHRSWRLRLERKHLEIIDLFPENWYGRHMRYEIIVRAKKIRKLKTSKE